MTPTLWDAVNRCRVYDLAQPLEHGMPVSPNHPGFKLALMRRHGDMERADGSSASNEMMLLGGHTGTHVDALCHVSLSGRLHGGADAYEAQHGGRFKSHGVDEIPLTFCRGVMLDVPALHGVESLAPGAAISAADLEAACERQGVEVRAGDAVLIRSGWPRHWSDTELFRGVRGGAPGPDESAGRWLAGRKIRLTGAETIAYEHIPAGRGHALLPVHVILLVESGIHIIEVMHLTALARDRSAERLVVPTPLPAAGATGAPGRPVALVPREDAG